jgi:hypothetical protein
MYRWKDGAQCGGLDRKHWPPYVFGSEQVEASNLCVLSRELHEGHHGDGGLRGARLIQVDARKVNKLEIIKGSLRDVVVKLLHRVPRPVADSDAHDAERVTGSLHDGIDRLLSLVHLPVCYDDQDVKLPRLLDD